MATTGCRGKFKALRHAGLIVNIKRVARLMRLHGMAGRFRRRRIRTTFPGPYGYQIPDLVGRRFAPAPPMWPGARTLPTSRPWEGWLYPASVLDLGSCRLLGDRWPTTCAPSWSSTP